MSADKRAARIFVGGSERSGTTLLQNMLDCHPQICGAPEFMHFPDILRLRNKMHHSVEQGWIDLFCSRDQVDQAVRNFMESFLDNFMKHRDTPIVSEKTPTNVLVFEEMLDVFPHARFLCIVRDPRDVVASLMKVGERAKKQGETPKEITIDLEAAIRHVRSCLDAGFRALDLAPERVGLVQYERLVREPARTTKAVCEFLSIPWSEAMLHPEQKRHPGEDAILNDVWYDRNSYYSAPDPDRIGRWKKRLSPSQKVAVNRAFSSDERLSKLGYALSADRLRIRDRVIGGIGHFTRRVIDEGRRRIRV